MISGVRASPRQRHLAGRATRLAACGFFFVMEESNSNEGYKRMLYLEKAIEIAKVTTVKSPEELLELAESIRAYLEPK